MIKILYLSTALLAWGGPGPSADEIRKAEALMTELYGEDLRKAEGDRGAQARLANLLLAEAKETTDSRAGRAVLFGTALRLALASGELGVALQAADERLRDRGASLQSSDALREKRDVVVKIAETVTSADALQTLADAALALADEAIQADEYAVGAELLRAAEKAGLGLKSVALVSAVRKKLDDAIRAEKAYAQWKPFVDRLGKNPGDAEAASKVGAYLAFGKGAWEAGLPLLAKGSRAEWKAAALADQRTSQTIEKGALSVADAVETIDVWSGLLASADFDAGMKAQVALRAYHWAQAVSGSATADDVRTRALETMERLTPHIPPELRVGEIVAERKRGLGHVGPVYAADFSPDGKKAVSVGADGTIRLWDVRSGKELRRFEGMGGRMWAVAFASDGRRVVTGGFDGSVRVWDLLTGREARRLGSHGDYVRSVRFADDDRFVISAGDDAAVRVWDVSAGREVRSLQGHGHFVWAAAPTRDGKRILSASLDRTAKLWSAADGKLLRTFTGHADTVLAAALTPDERRAVTASSDHSLRVWDLESGATLKALMGHASYVVSVGVSPDGRRAISGAADGSIRLWDLASGQSLRKLDGHRETVWSVAFSRDGRMALSAGQDGTVRFWGGAK